MNELRAFLFCRVNREEAKNLLDYQEKELTRFAHCLNFRIVASSKEVASGKHFESWGMHKLIHYIVREKIDAILIYDKTRISVHEDLYAEFKMLCDMHHVSILMLDQLKKIHLKNGIYHLTKEDIQNV